MHFRRIGREDSIRLDSELWNLVFPENLHAPEELVANYNSVLEGTLEEHWAISDGGRDIGLITGIDPEGRAKPEMVNLNVLIRPELEKDVFPEVFDIAESIAWKADVGRVSIWTTDKETFRNAYLRDRGYRCVQSVPVTRLELASFDFTPFLERLQRVQESGIRITTAAELDSEGFDWVPPLHEATWEMVQDVPMTHQPVNVPVEAYREMMKDKATYNWELMFIALDGDRVVGYSRVTPAQSMPGLVRTGLSGTVRSHRRRGVVTALKIAGIQRLQQLGYRWLQTDNDETNPMYQLNLQLGFKVVWHYLQHERTLATATINDGRAVAGAGE